MHVICDVLRIGRALGHASFFLIGVRMKAAIVVSAIHCARERPVIGCEEGRNFLGCLRHPNEHVETALIVGWIDFEARGIGPCLRMTIGSGSCTGRTGPIVARKARGRLHGPPIVDPSERRAVHALFEPIGLYELQGAQGRTMARKATRERSLTYRSGLGVAHHYDTS